MIIKSDYNTTHTVAAQVWNSTWDASTRLRKLSFSKSAFGRSMMIFLVMAGLEAGRAEDTKGQSVAGEVRLFSDDSVSLYRSSGATRTYSLRNAGSTLDTEMQAGRNSVRSISININARTIVSARPSPWGVVLSLFLLKADGDIIMKYDLNSDGVFDASVDRNTGAYSIFINGNWARVSRLKSLFEKTPTATLDGKVYIFKDDKWTPE